MEKKEIFIPSPVDWVDRKIVTVNKNVITLDALAESDLKSLLKMKEKIDQCLEIAKSTIANACFGKANCTCDSEIVNVSFTPAVMRRKFNEKKFKEDYPKLYEEYMRESEVKPSIRMSLKTEKVALTTMRYVDANGIVHGLGESEEEKEKGEGDKEVVANNSVGADYGE